jgi:hypothetical protein
MAEQTAGSVTIAHRRFELRRDGVERAMRGVLPEPISSHYVVIGPRRYPPKQVIGILTGLDRADFTSHQARRVLMRLGFPVGRARREPDGEGRRRDAGDLAPHPILARDSRAKREHALAETLASFRGQWVAVKDDELLVAAPTPQELVGWLARHDRRADSMFRVPEDELAAGGLAPL